VAAQAPLDQDRPDAFLEEIDPFWVRYCPERHRAEQGDCSTEKPEVKEHEGQTAVKARDSAKVGPYLPFEKAVS
jgi:hypothetical protein